MSRTRKRLAPSVLALAAAGLAAPAFAADTTTTIAVGVTQSTAVTASPVTPDTYTLNILGTLRQGGAASVTGVSIQGSGSGPVVINNDGRLQGRFNFTGSSPVTMHNDSGANPATQGWHTGGVTTFGSGADLIDNGEDGVIAATTATTFAFGAGTDRFTNAGRLITERSNAAGTLTITGLETFENSGLILLGSKFNAAGDSGDASDEAINDRLVAQGAAFIGSGASRIAMDANLTGLTQVGCPTTPTAADCVDFTGGSTAGSTLLTIRDMSGNSDGGVINAGITLIAGSSAAGHFSLDPNSDYYTVQTTQGPVLQKRLIAYRLVYDDTNDRHMLVGELADEAYQPATFAASAQETWRASMGSWLTRQADMRATPGGLQPSKGAWARLGGGMSEREVEGYDLDHKQTNAHLIFGADLVGAAGDDSAWVIGAMMGFVRSDVEYDANPTEFVDRGFTGGLYASYVAGPLFVDVAGNVNLLKMTVEAPNLSLAPGAGMAEDIKSLGGQVEAGWRFDLGGVFVEPLAGVSYVTTKFDDLAVPGGGGRFDFEDKYTSLRTGAGVRVGTDSQLMGMTTAYSLTGRYWEESEGENGAAVTVGAVTTPMMDDFSGGFSEVTGSVNLFSEDGGVSGFINLGGKFADGYNSIDGAVGVRLRW